MWRWVRRNPVAATFLFFTTIGCTLTGGLAIALAKSEADECEARASAESARDELKAALAAAETARQVAEKEKTAAASAKEAADQAREAARQEAKRALEQKKEADAAQALSEDNLRVARGVIRVSLRELSRQPRFEDDDYREARLTLIKQVRTFRDTVTLHAPNTPEWLDDIADVSHWLGFLEYLNNNQDAAAVEYRIAADAARRWAALEPQKPEPRARQAYSLVNAGNALFNARRFRESEQIYRDAIKLYDAVVAEVPRDEFLRRQAVEAYSNLSNVLRATNQLAEWEQTALDELTRANDLVRECGDQTENIRTLATAQLSFAKALARAQKWDDADCYFAISVTNRELVRDAFPTVPRYAFDYASALLSHANFLQSRGQADRAGETFLLAVGILEKAQATPPNTNAYCTDLASGWTQYADFLRNQRRYPEAERRYNQSLELTAIVIRRAPTFRTARDVATTAAIGRAHLYNHTGRHREAAAEWVRLAKEDPDVRMRPRHELFAIQSLLFAGDWKAAQTAAEVQMKLPQPGWMWLDIGRVWCLVIRQIETDTGLTATEKSQTVDDAMQKAIACLEKAKAAGEFEVRENVAWFTNNLEFAPVRDKFDPAKK
jgi:tetratricopeptide (TPR) repeat protein